MWTGRIRRRKTIEIRRFRGVVNINIIIVVANQQVVIRCKRFSLRRTFVQRLAILTATAYPKLDTVSIVRQVLVVARRVVQRDLFDERLLQLGRCNPSLIRLDVERIGRVNLMKQLLFRSRWGRCRWWRVLLLELMNSIHSRLVLNRCFRRSWLL